MAQQPISAYGLIGDMRTAALVGLDGAIDWCCLPRFDSGSVFAAILDPERGGTWSIRPADAWKSTQRYVARTNVLETTFENGGGRVVLTDFMPVDANGRPSGERPEIHRRVRCTRGVVEMRMVFMPRFDYASRSTRLEPLAGGLIATDRTDQVVTLTSAQPFQWSLEYGTAVTSFQVERGRDRWIVLRYDDDDVYPVDLYESGEKLEVTTAFWQRWSAGVHYTGPYRSMVKRSALALKLLTHAGSGAIIAAPTTSLPETLGGSRNWDYRFVWLRDAAFTLEALDAVGHHAEADQFMRFLKRVCRHEGGKHLQIMYGIDGRRDLVERQLEHLSGYRNSRPVRIGNGAAGQLQLDVYGEVLETADRWRRHHGMSEGTWRVLRPLVDWVAGHWRQPDSGIWEVRNGPFHFTHSKVMCWVALDRAARLADRGELPAAPAPRWRREADAIRAFVDTQCWSEALGSYTRTAGSGDVDASLLMLPLVEYPDPGGRRIGGIIDAVNRLLRNGDVVYRYHAEDGVPGGEGCFLNCSFWLAGALARCGRVAEATALMDRLVGRANDVGLFAEEIDPATGAFLGNFPQALVHLALIDAAIAISQSAAA